jgi:hypothetical protein
MRARASLGLPFLQRLGGIDDELRSVARHPGNADTDHLATVAGVEVVSGTASVRFAWR